MEPLTEEEVRTLFLNANALLNGHFRLSSGRHSAEYWEKFKVLQHPDIVQRLCGEIARRYADAKIEVVMGPTTGGILLALETARQLGVKALYAEKEDGKRTLRRGFTLPAGTRTLIVDDILTSGGALKECLELAHENKAIIVGTAVLVDRSGGTVLLGLRQEALLTVEAVTFSPENCPLCAQGDPVREPGTTFLTK